MEDSSFVSMNPLINTPFWIISYKWKRRFGKLILFIDRARQHHRSIIVREYIEQNKDVLKVIYFPKGSSEFNAVEECWRQGKYDLLISRYYQNFANFRHTIANYYRTRRFKLDIVKYLSI